jgi:carbamate kinase
MGPKVEALCRFATTTQRAGVVTSIERALDGLEGRAGTMIAP